MNTEIQEAFNDINKLYNTINTKLLNFITKARELVALSEDDYQIEKTWQLNKISLKGYVLDSDCCVRLSNNGILDYSIDDLKSYLTQYENSYAIDYSRYFLAISLYEIIEDIEESIHSKVNLEISMLSKIIPSIGNVSNTDKVEYEKLCAYLKEQLDTNRLNEESYNICIQVLNDLFNFYISKDNIPSEYLLTDENDGL